MGDVFHQKGKLTLFMAEDVRLTRRDHELMLSWLDGGWRCICMCVCLWVRDTHVNSNKRKVPIITIYLSFYFIFMTIPE